MLGRNGQITKGKGFITNDLTNAEMEFIEQHREDPSDANIATNRTYSSAHGDLPGISLSTMGIDYADIGFMGFEDTAGHGSESLEFSDLHDSNYYFSNIDLGQRGE